MTAEAPRTILISGATDGLGRAVAERLAAAGNRLILHGRDPQRLAAVAAQIRTLIEGPAPETVVADLADLSQVRRLSERVFELTDRLDVFVSNAGIGSGAPDGRARQTSVDGHELRFAVNYLAGFDLALRLLPLLRAARPARVIHVASLGQAAVDFDDVMIERDYSGSRAYGQSKLAQITSGFTMAGRLDPEVVTVNSLHPSTMMPTKMVVAEYGRTVDSLEEGEIATRRLVEDPELSGVTGTFFDRLREARVDASAYDPQVRTKLWEISLALTGAPDIPS
ncbi:MAG TPA: SDR family NAD(P)-dependent oxidoreductase [Frankiaceae bacterium]|jgi:NAD(P)-dependent dehydrogenase (short-subunit alcohol dehydrogenase family)|nr:SDR family NAD(P)-dependent oxidoreductase [Frankiaceae bacterium]